MKANWMKYPDALALPRPSVCVALVALAALLASGGTAEATLWQPGDVLTYTQASWPDTPAGAELLGLGYDLAYSANEDILEVGLDAGNNIEFGSAADVLKYLPQSGTPAVLMDTYTDPISTESGIFGGDVVALKLNVDFSDTGSLVGTLGIPFGDIILNFPAASPYAVLSGLTVRQFLADANTSLGGGPGVGGLTFDLINDLTASLNASFNQGNVGSFTQDYLVAPSTPVSGLPEPANWVLVSVGLLVLAATLRRRRQSGPIHSSRWRPS